MRVMQIMLGQIKVEHCNIIVVKGEDFRGGCFKKPFSRDSLIIGFILVQMEIVYLVLSVSCRS